MEATTITDALFDAVADILPLHKSATNTHFGNKYVPLEEVMAAVQPALRKRGILLLQTLETIDGAPALRTTFTLIPARSKQSTTASFSTIVPLILDKQTPQGVGSAITYMRRYALLSALGLVADADDDAEATESAAPPTNPAPLALRAGNTPWTL